MAFLSVKAGFLTVFAKIALGQSAGRVGSNGSGVRVNGSVLIIQDYVFDKFSSLSPPKRGEGVQTAAIMKTFKGIIPEDSHVPRKAYGWMLSPDRYFTRASDRE